jgi:uncharacterized membrane protein (TIGR02234 family)
VTDAPDPRGRRSFLVTLVVLALGAVLLLLASGRTWSTTVVGGTDVPAITVALTGGDLVAGGAVALLVLAGIAGLAATRRVGRVVVGVLLVLAGLGTVVVAVVFGTTWGSSPGAGDTVRGLALERAGTVGPTATTVTAWWIAAVVAGLLMVAGGVLAIVASASWPQMGRRYERREALEGPARDVASRSAWDQLDEGVDPTDGPGPDDAGGTTDATTGDATGDTTGDPRLRSGGDS